MSEKTPSMYAAEALGRFVTAMSAKGVEPDVTLLSMWTVCNVQMRRGGLTPQQMADLLISFQRMFTNATTN